MAPPEMDDPDAAARRGLGVAEAQRGLVALRVLTGW